MAPKPVHQPTSVVIVGGGLAGLAAAAALAGRGLPITLLESRPRLGGRASSFVDPATGENIDNCQHVSLGCCTNLDHFCRRVGAESLLRRERAVVFLGPDGRLSRLEAGPLPAPFHLSASFLRLRFLSFTEKLKIARGLAALALKRDERPGEPFSLWLLRHGQTVRTVSLFWAAVLVSALNERLEQMDVGHARKVFLDGFLRNRRGYEMVIPLVPLGELYGTRLEEWLARKGVQVRLTTGAKSIECDDEGSIAGVRLRSGETLRADFVVLAVPFERACGLLADDLRARLPGVERIDGIQASPITGIHFWFDRPVCPLPHVATLGKLVQWVFNHTALQGREAAEGGQYLQLVVSASYDLLPLEKTAIRDVALAELAELWPAAREAKLLRWWVVTEHTATFSTRPGIDSLRPRQRTAVEGFFLAGDYTATGWPATMEGAVRSGYLAAECVLEDLGRPERIVRPSLRPGWLSRILLGRPGPDRPAV
ncbi:MAG TPA: hydroxysqualene dehydroxylase HpnE, partial [Isosphaeraceae bacterium]|nr:hydroxysqualene dehydroxylase HpnE [Isosphaeraceae bacterium]